VSIIEKAAGRLDRNKAQGRAEEGTPQERAHASEAPAQGSVQITPELLGQAAAPQATAPQATATQPPAPQAPAREARQVTINLDYLHRTGMITPDAGRTPLAEEFRIIKRPLIRNAFQKDASPHSNLIMVTSALPSEGKTFCAINLALSIAKEMDHTVLLVDADVARPSVPRYLGLNAKEGLMDVLLDDQLDLADVMLKTNIDTLRILPAGRPHKNATELLASLTMSTLLDEISRRYSDRIVIFDSPPLLITSEARVLASRMGQIVMVVEAETTTRHAVKDALRHLGHADNVSLVYNKSRAFAGVESYSYGYN
jgi:exopolysaccharide/PEP-CTERM locus tyrosine autokinase